MNVELKGKAALVTGAARRVGKAIAVELGRAGCDVMVHYNGTSADQTLGELREMGVRAESFKADMNDPDAIRALFDDVEKQFGRLDILVNSAAIFDQGDLRTLSLEDWQRSLDVNLTAPFLCTQHAVRLMGAAGGTIVNISDLGGLLGSVEYPQHSVSKAALLMLTRLGARSFGPGVRVNAIVPGNVMQPPDMDDATWAKLAGRTPLKRPGSGEDVGRAVVYLCREDFLTGVVLTVDAGEYLL